MPAVSLTDHGSMAGAVQLWKATRGTGVKPVVGCEVYVADDRRAHEKGNAHLTLLAADNAGYANLIKLSSLGYLEGYYYKPRVDWELLEQHNARRDRAVRLPLRTGLQGARGEPRRPTPRAELDRLAQVFGARQRLRRAAERAPAVQERILPQLVELATEAKLPTVATGDVHYLRHSDARAHEALLCIQSGDSLKNPNHWKFETDHFYFKTPEEMALDFPGHADAMRRTLEVAERCNVELELGRSCCPPSRRPRAATRSTTSSSSARKACKSATARSTAELQRAAAVRAQDDQGDGLHRLLPDRLGLHPLRERTRDQRRPRPRLRRRLARRLLPRDHRHRPDPLRPAVRALPQPGPQVDARHRHRLRRRRPRARHQLRHREVRPRPRRADHHLLDDGRPRRRPRRGPRARGALRRRRQDRQADPGRSRPDARRVPQAGRRAAQGGRRRPGREGDHRARACRSRA